MPKLIKASTEDNSNLGTNLVVGTFMRVLSMIDKKAFEEVSMTKAPTTRLPPKMDALTLKALTFDALLTQYQVKAFRMYMLAATGFNPFPIDTEVKALDAESFVPTWVPFKDKNRNRASCSLYSCQ